MFLLFLIISILVLVYSPIVRYSLVHLPKVVYNACVDIARYMRYRKWNEFKNFGRMDIYIADDAQPFGSGKTLNAVADTLSIYHNYNDVKVFNEDSGEWCKQYVHIISNIELYSVPFVRLRSTQQITDIVNMSDDDGNKHIFVILIDELGRIFNNRDWKTNLPSDLLGALLQQRKSKVVLKGTVQDFSLFDATMRKVSSLVYVCHKRWRFLVRDIYTATDLERSGYNTRMIQSRGNRCGFATNRLYCSYNTNEVVEDLVRSISDGTHISNYEILQESMTNLPYVAHSKRKKHGREVA